MQEKVFIIMGFIYKKAVNAHFFKVNNVILARIVMQAAQTGLQVLFSFFQLLNGKLLPIGSFYFF